MTPPTLTSPGEAALRLMPELSGRPPAERTARHVLGRVLASVAALVLVLGVVATGLLFTLRSTDQFVHEDVAVASLPGSELEEFSRWAKDVPAQPAAPVVLTYHDIQPEPVKSPYVVTPEAFARQMAMLQAAGYRSLTAAQFVAYQKGSFTPPARSFLLTFDDGTAGLWRYADSVLARFGFTAVSFLITGRVGTSKPYYLTWDLVEQMKASGRWDFESHTANLHTRVPVSPSGALGGALSHRMVVNGRLESRPEFEERIRRDLEQSIRDITSHGLPRPVLFAYPFSDVVASGVDGEEAAVPRTIVSTLFAAAFVDVAPGALPASRREVLKQVIGRAEVFHKDDELALFHRLQEMETLPVSSLDPLTVDSHWLEDGGAYPAPVQVTANRLTVDALTETYVTAGWAPQRTSDWVDYAVTCRAAGLLPDGANGAGLTVRVGSGDEVQVRVSQHSLQVTRGGRPVGAPMALAVAAAHQVEVVVRQMSTTVRVDGRELLVLASDPGPATFGGFGVVFSRTARSSAFPTLVGLHVNPVP